MRLRGWYSQGLALPVQSFPDPTAPASGDLTAGRDVTALGGELTPAVDHSATPSATGYSDDMGNGEPPTKRPRYTFWLLSATFWAIACVAAVLAYGVGVWALVFAGMALASFAIALSLRRQSQSAPQ